MITPTVSAVFIPYACGGRGTRIPNRLTGDCFQDSLARLCPYLRGETGTRTQTRFLVCCLAGSCVSSCATSPSHLSESNRRPRSYHERALPD